MSWQLKQDEKGRKRLEMKDLSPKYTDHVCYKTEWNQAYKLSSLQHSFNILFLGSKHIGRWWNSSCEEDKRDVRSWVTVVKGLNPHGYINLVASIGLMIHFLSFIRGHQSISEYFEHINAY